MLKDSALLKQRHEKFIKQICESGIVWGLKNKDGFAISASDEFEDIDGNALEIICFWSEKTMAKSCAIEDWIEYKTVEISLSEFIESWCVGMYNESILSGTNFDQNMFGFESNPLELATEIAKELKRTGKEIVLKNYKNLDDLLKDIELIEKE